MPKKRKIHSPEFKAKVALIEKNAYPRDATVRNFGQIVPSGFGSKWQEYGLASLELYKAIQKQADVTLRKHGSIYVASDAEELTLGVYGIATSIRNREGRTIAAMGLSGPSVRLTNDTIPQLAELLMKVAYDVSAELGYERQQQSMKYDA